MDASHQAPESGGDRLAERKRASRSVERCVAKVPEFSFGNFVMRDFTIMPKISNDALLGMNVLRPLRMEQQNGVMRIVVR